MNFTIDKRDFSKPLTALRRVIPSGASLPALSNVLIAAQDGHLTLSGTNLDMGARYRVAANIEEGGMVTLPARFLADLVRELPDGQLAFEGPDRTIAVRIALDSYKARLKGIDADEYPMLPAFNPELPGFTLQAAALRQLEQQVAFAAGRDSSRPTLQGVLTEVSVGLYGGEMTPLIRMASTDGFRLAASAPQSIERAAGAEPFSFILPARTLSEVARLCQEDPEGQVQCTWNEKANQVFFSLGDIEIFGQVIEGRYPDYRQLIPEETPIVVTADLAPLSEAARLGGLFVRGSNAQAIHISIEAPDRLRVSAHDDEMGEHQVVLEPVTIAGELPPEGMVVTLNGVFLKQGLAAIRTDQVEIGVTAPSRPVSLRPVEGDSFTYVMMPLAPKAGSREDAS